MIIKPLIGDEHWQYCTMLLVVFVILFPITIPVMIYFIIRGR